MLHRLIRVSGAVEIMVGAMINVFTTWPPLVSWALVGIGAITLAIELPGLWSDLQKILKRMLSRGPIWWDLDNYSLAANSDEHGSVNVTAFELSGVVRQGGLAVSRALLESKVTGETREFQIRTNSGFVSANNTNPFPKGASVAGRTLFFDPSRPTGSREGMPLKQFVESWSSFDLRIITSGDMLEFRTRIPWKLLSRRFRDWSPASGPSAPRITVRER